MTIKIMVIMIRTFNKLLITILNRSSAWIVLWLNKVD